MSDGDVILTRDKSTGRVHKRTVVGRGLQTFEGDNLDQAGAYTILGPLSEMALFNLVPGECCERCFPLPAFEATIDQDRAT
jgi:hypothetical protein